MSNVESEARKALNRLKRAVEKSRRELEAVEGALRHVEGDDFPVREYDEARERMQGLLDFVGSEGARLQDKVLHSGGLEPGRIRRSSS